MLVKLRLLWRVRRKLILSYIFIGVVPSLLIVIFFLLGGVLIFMNVSAYLFKDGYDSLVDYVEAGDESAASRDVARPGDRRTRRSRASIATRRARIRAVAGVCPASGPPPVRRASPPPGWRCCAHAIVLGPWEHMRGARGRPRLADARLVPGRDDRRALA